MKYLVMKALGTLASFAFMVALFGNGTTCAFIIHQPKVPAALLKLK